jgi:hypothetical protein
VAAKMAVQCLTKSITHSFIVFKGVRETYGVVVNQSLILPARSGSGGHINSACAG